MLLNNPFKAYDPFLSSFNKNDENRIRIILAATVLDELLTQLLSRKTINKKIYKDTMDSVSFAYKNDIAYAFGLIPKEIYDDINRIRKLRNMAAHENINTFPAKKLEEAYSSFHVKKAVETLKLDHLSKVDLFYVGCCVIFVYLTKRINRSHRFRAQKYDINDLGFDEADKKAYFKYISSSGLSDDKVISP